MSLDELLETVVGFVVKTIVILIATLPLWLIPLLVCEDLGNGSILRGIPVLLIALIRRPWLILLMFVFLCAAIGIWLERR